AGVDETEMHGHRLALELDEGELDLVAHSVGARQGFEESAAVRRVERAGAPGMAVQRRKGWPEPADIAAGHVERVAAPLERLGAIADLPELARVLDDPAGLELPHGDWRQGLHAHGPVDVALRNLDDMECRGIAGAELGDVDDVPQLA